MNRREMGCWGASSPSRTASPPAPAPAVLPGLLGGTCSLGILGVFHKKDKGPDVQQPLEHSTPQARAPRAGVCGAEGT